MVINLVSSFKKNVGSVTGSVLRLISSFPIPAVISGFTRKESCPLIRSTVAILLMMVSLFICTSCRSDSDPSDPFSLLYTPYRVPFSGSSDRPSVSYPSLTLSASSMPFPVLCRVLSDTFSVGLVFAENLSQKTITAEFKDTSLPDVLDVISRQLNTDVVKVGKTFFIGSPRAQDRGILVRRVLGFSNEDLLKASQAVLSDKGKVTCVGSGILSASDAASVLQRLSELLDYLSSIDSPVWIVQLAFLTINRDLLIEGGFKVTTSGSLSYNVSDNELSLKNINLDGILNAAMQSSFADVHSCPMLLCRDGSSSSWKYGRRVPIPKRTVSDQGTISVTGFDYIDVGFNVSLTVRQSTTGALLTLDIGKSDIESYVDVAPVTAQNVYSFSADMVPLRPYLLGELSTFTDLNKQTDIFNFGKTRGKSSVQVWGQVYKISSSCLRQYPGAIGEGSAAAESRTPSADLSRSGGAAVAGDSK